MITLLLIQSLLIVGLILFALYWKLHTSERLQALRRSNAEFLASENRVQTVLLNLQLELNELKERESAPVPASLPPAISVPNIATVPVVTPGRESVSEGLTIAKRSQALKMIRRGESPEAVSAALAVPRSQILLLIKVQGLIHAQNAPNGAEKVQLQGGMAR